MQDGAKKKHRNRTNEQSAEKDKADSENNNLLVSLQGPPHKAESHSNPRNIVKPVSESEINEKKGKIRTIPTLKKAVTRGASAEKKQILSIVFAGLRSGE